MQNRSEILSYLDTLSLLLLSAVFLLFPLVFASVTSDAFILPKQILIAVGLFLLLILFGIRTLVEGKLRLRATPLDLPVFVFAVVAFISSILAVNRTDSIIAYIPLLFAVLLYFVTVNTVRDRRGILYLSLALILGTSLASLLSILSFFKLYILPFDYTHVSFFTPLGNLMDQALLLGIVLPLAGYLAHPTFSSVILKGKTEENAPVRKLQPLNIAFGVGFVVVTGGLVVTLYQLMTTQNPLILPFWMGLQHGLSAISRDTTRSIQSFLFGSGYGTYLTDFTRFKEPIYNANPKLWSFTFFRSSTFFFELLATTGFLGILSYLFIIYRVFKEKWFFIPLFLILLASFFLPFSYVLQALLFMMLALFALVRSQQNPRRYPITELYLVALNQGLLSTRHEGNEASETRKNSLILPILTCLILIIFIGVIGFYSTLFVLSDVTFQRSLAAARNNNGGTTYQLQRQAIETFPHRDAYYRVFSQTNLALANNLAAAQPQGASPSAETQQTILTLIQQSINSGRTAVTLSPQTSLNWNNLSSIYRSLIGFGQNADQFALLTNQQAIALDPNNPQQYVNLGGIYYQLGQWEEAQRNFQLAITLKPDYANAYYNLGHALESKGDLTNALEVYKTVRSLVANDKEGVQKMDGEIAALQQKIGQQASAEQQAQEASGSDSNDSLNVNQPRQQLPERNPQVEIPGPTVSPTPRTSVSPTQAPAQETPTPTVSPSPTQ